MTKQFTIYPAIIAFILLIIAPNDFPYGYYEFLRLMVTIISGYYAYWVFKRSVEKTFWFWGLLTIAILFNPIFPIHLGDKDIWANLDVISALFFLCLITKYIKDNTKLLIGFAIFISSMLISGASGLSLSTALIISLPLSFLIPSMICLENWR